MQTQASQKVVDIMHYHIGDAGPLIGTWDEAKDLYKKILRDPENINFFTIFREPREHLMSYYSYFLEPKTHVSCVVLQMLVLVARLLNSSKMVSEGGQEWLRQPLREAPAAEKRIHLMFVFFCSLLLWALCASVVLAGRVSFCWCCWWTSGVDVGVDCRDGPGHRVGASVVVIGGGWCGGGGFGSGIVLLLLFVLLLPLLRRL